MVDDECYCSCDDKSTNGDTDNGHCGLPNGRGSRLLHRKLRNGKAGYSSACNKETKQRKFKTVIDNSFKKTLPETIRNYVRKQVHAFALCLNADHLEIGRVY